MSGRSSIGTPDRSDAPYGYAEIRGEATLTADGGQELIDELSVKYTGKPYGELRDPGTPPHTAGKRSPGCPEPSRYQKVVPAIPKGRGALVSAYYP